MDVVALGIVLIVLTVVSVGIVGVLFVWAARKDGEANDAVRAGGHADPDSPFRGSVTRSRPRQRGGRRRPREPR